jgi:hypothetical protein
MSHVFVPSDAPSLRRSYSLESVRAPSSPPLQLDPRFSRQLEQWTKEAISDEEEKDNVARRSFSRRLSETWRRSWANRRSYLAVIGKSDEDDESDWNGQGRKEVKRVKWKLRDWSGELSEDDIGVDIQPYKRKYNTPIIWAENAYDIAKGRYWRYISPTD